MPTGFSSWSAPPKGFLSPGDEEGSYAPYSTTKRIRRLTQSLTLLARSTVIFPPRGNGVLTVQLHSVTRMGVRSPLSATDQWPVYAILECESFQICAKAAWSGGKRGNALWRETFHFDVSSSPDLVVSLFARNRNAPGGSQVEPRGHFKVTAHPDGSFPVGKLRVDVQDGAGLAELTVAYSQQQVPPVEDPSAWELHEGGGDGFSFVTKRDTDQAYATARAQPHAEKENSLRSSISHPFIAPLKFAFTSTAGAGLTLLSPLARGGHLFHQLQRERRFDGDKARFYAAELVLALEYLHSRDITCALLSPAHVLLDAYGHISLCSPSIYSHSSPMSGAVPRSPEFTVPELVLRHKTTQAVDWWMLGALLYEMLAGRPPFYHTDPEEQQRRILHQTLQFPPGLPSAVTDILTALLNKDPAQRLGANGAAEVKNHAFFHGVAWQDLLQRKAVGPWQPDSDNRHIYRLESFERDVPKHRPRRLSRGTLYERRDDLAGFGATNFWQPIGHEMSESERRAFGDASSTHPNDDDWELTWDPTSNILAFTPKLASGEHTAEIFSPAEPPKPGPAAHSLPSTEQLKDALAAALKAGYGSKVVSQVLKYGVDLNTPVLHYDHVPADTGIIFDIKHDQIPITPLEWAVEHNRPDLVTLFLEGGADPNHTYHPAHGPALVRAAQRRAPALARLLVAGTRRVARTRALCAAVDQQDVAVVDALLTSGGGVRCDFEAADVPPPSSRAATNFDNGFTTGPRLLAPLVRAVRLGDARVVRRLLAHGADVDAGYHCDGATGLLPPLGRRPRGWDDDEDGGGVVAAAAPRRVNFACGRAVQLARELGHDEIVGLLVGGGADVRRPQPVWAVEGHACPPVPRAAWLAVTVGLEEGRVTAGEEV